MSRAWSTLDALSWSIDCRDHGLSLPTRANATREGESPLARNASVLSEWQETVHADGSRRLYLLCTNEIAGQVERAIGAALGARLPLRPADRGEWTHRYPLSRPLTNPEEAFLGLLGHVLTLRVGPPNIVAVALDWYKDPKSNEDPNLWANTRVGELVHQGKYLESDGHARRLAAEMAQVIGQHLHLGRAEVVVSVPSHSPRHFSERLATAVARLRRLPVVPMTDKSVGQVKETAVEERPPPEFAIDPATIEGRRVLLIDDVSRAGETLRSAAEFLQSAGAASVCALVAVRTMRN
jgi:hypoxanthine-guanine phosphoribosyltransferase